MIRIQNAHMKLAFALLIWIQTFALGADVPLDSESFERLVYNNSPVGSDVLPRHEDPTALPRWKEKLSQIADVNERLLELVNRDYFVLKNPETLGLSLFALSTRENLSPDQLERLTALLDGMKAPNREWTALEKQFICGALPVLRYYPSPRHEALAIRFVEDTDVTITMNALCALGGIGTRNSLASVQNAVKRRQARFPGSTDRTMKNLEAAADQVEKRVASLESTPNPPDVTTPISGPKRGDQAGSVIRPPSNGEVSHFPSIVWVAVIVAAIGLLWMALKKQRS